MKNRYVKVVLSLCLAACAAGLCISLSSSHKEEPIPVPGRVQLRLHESLTNEISDTSALAGMDKRIATPRLKSPRVKIEGGSVGIAGEQTGIYPVASPGGWQLIGRTPLKLYDSEREKPVLLESGQYIKFRPVTEEEYKAIEKQVENDTYQYVVYDKEAE